MLKIVNKERKIFLSDPKLSVIIPGYNVEQYITECLDSVAEQTFTDYEVILIDDGSPDQTGKIMDLYASKYNNFRVMHISNVGISAARNIGIKESKGKYIAFVDSDDLLLPNSYETLVGSLEKTGSEIAVGGVQRFNSKKNARSFLHKKAVRDTITETSISYHPELIYDTTVWNKVYKKSLIIDNNLYFPEGVIYEDITFTLEAHFLAKKIDIIDKIIYKWRWREGDNRSFTQRRDDTRYYKHRLLAISNALKIINKYDENQITPHFMKKVYEVDIPLFIPEPKDADLDYLIDFQKLTYRFMQQIGTEYIDYVRPNKQVPLRALLDGDIDAMSDYEAYYKWGQEIKQEKGNLVFTNDYLSDKKWAKTITLENSVPLSSKIGSIEKKQDSVYIIDGMAYASYSQNIKHHMENYSVKLIKVDGQKKETIEVPFKQKKTKLLKDSYRRKTTVGLSIELNFNSFYSTLSEGIWKIKVSDCFGDLKSDGFLANPKKGAKSPGKFIINNYLVDFHYNNNWELSLIIKEIRNEIKKVEISNDQVSISGKFVDEISTIKISSRENINDHFILNTISSSSNLIKTEFDSRIPDGEYKLSLLDKNENIVDVVVTHNLDEDKYTEDFYRVKVYNNSLDSLVCELTKAQGQIVDIQLNDKLCYLKIELLPCFLNEVYKLRFVSNNGQNKYVVKGSVTKEKNILFEIPLFDESRVLFSPNRYKAYLDIISEKVESFKIFAPMEMRDEYIQKRGNFQTKFWFTRKGELRVTISEDWGKWDNSKLKRGLSYSIAYPLMRLFPLKNNIVVYDSFWASKYNDNPKAMYQYLYKNHPELHHIWVLKNTDIEIDGPAEKVRRNSLKYWYYMARGKFFIENTNFPNQYAKRNGQVEVQTFHGTFMKTMGFDEPQFKYGSKRKQDNFEKRNKRWDLTISPSPYMSNKIRDAYNYEEEVIECGYPRNDQLHVENNENKINSIKNSLEIPFDKKIILYAPTYRNKEGFDFNLDLQNLREKLGDDFVLLIRLHYFVANHINIENFEPFAIDVSNYPEINDLYLISDALITDYSSVMFDYGHLKKPMIFFPYDYEDYVNDSRGVYLDYEKIVPGPIVKTSEALINCLLHFDKLTDYDDRINNFYDEFCSFGDGNSAKIASERLLQKESNYISENLILTKIKKVVKFNKWFGKLLAYNGKKKKKNIIIFETFFGRNYSDNPKAMYQYIKEHYPDYKFVWSVNPEYVKYFKDNKIPFVKRMSLRSTFTTGRAKYWILNTRLPLSMKKPKNTKLIQTWHGTPLKTLGRDVSLMTMPGKDAAAYHKDVIKDSSKWDYCLSPNAYSTEIFKRAFRLRNEQMINSGYPRNDILINYTKEQIEIIKKKLGIPADKKVILYAPTWRDNEYVKADQYTAKLHIDLLEMEKQFGNQAVLLVRTHYLISNSLHLENNNFCKDVSNYQDINDLYIISDLLITDYSSVFFDFANLHRPMIFYAYDLQDYAGEIRGFYFDYNEVPGPILTSENELYKEIKEQLHTPKLSNNFDTFTEKYCSWDDGNSSKRAVEFIFQDKGYELKKLDFEEEVRRLSEDIVLWSDAIGHGNYHILKNVLANNSQIKVKEKAVLIDPVQKIEVGTPSYFVENKDYQGWISYENYSLLTDTKE